MPMPGDDVFNAGEELFARLEHMHDLLTDHDKTSVRVVLTLEQVVIKEAQRSFTYFHLYNYPTDLVVANRVLPDNQELALLPGLVRRPAALRAAGREDVPPHPGQAGADVRPRDGGRAAPPRAGGGPLRRRGPDRSSSTAAGRTRSAATTGRSSSRSTCRSRDKTQINLSRHADELVIDLGTWRRTLVLPRILVDAPTDGATFADGTLKIRFRAPAR